MERFIIYPRFVPAKKPLVPKEQEEKNGQEQKPEAEEGEMVIVHYKDENGQWIAEK